MDETTKTAVELELDGARALEKIVATQTQRRFAAVESLHEALRRGEAPHPISIDQACDALRSSMQRLHQIGTLRSRLAARVRNPASISEQELQQCLDAVSQ